MAKRKYACVDYVDADGVERDIINFACAMIGSRRTDGQTDPVPTGWLERQIILNGKVGYLHSPTGAEGFYLVTSVAERDRYGVPTIVNAKTMATGASAFAVPVAADGGEEGKISLVHANASGSAPYDVIRRYAHMIAACEKHIDVNVIASMRSQVIAVAEGKAADLDLMIENSLEGRPTAIDQSFADVLQTFDVSVPLDAPAVYQLDLQLWADVLKRFGGITPASYKGERTQSAEVSATIAQSIDNVYVLIDHANADLRRGNIPYEFFYRGYGDAYDRQPAPDTMSNEPPTEGGESDAK